MRHPFVSADQPAGHEAAPARSRITGDAESRPG
jgi:hypothetical protein